MAINDVLSPNFYYAIINSIENNINSISPQDSLAAYIFFTYNQEQLPLNFQLHQLGQLQGKKQDSETEQLPTIIEDLLKILEKRVLAPQCLKFYKGRQVIALLHTFLKNCILRGLNLKSAQSAQKLYFTQTIEKIITRIQIVWVSQDFSVEDKINLLRIASSLPFMKRQLIISLFHSWLLKNPEKVDRNLLVEIYLASYEAQNLSPEIQKSLQNRIVQQLFNMKKEDVSRAAWLFTVSQATNLGIFLKKIQEIVFGGLSNKNYEIKQVAVLVWAVAANSSQKLGNTQKQDINKQQQFWRNIEDFFFEEINRKNQKSLKQQISPEEIISDCSWILWAYLNNKQLNFSTLDLLTQTLIGLLSSLKEQSQFELSAFELTNIASFYYTINYPPEAEPFIKEIKLICKQQFYKTFKSMECSQLCRILKFIGNQIWSEPIGVELLSIFETEVDEMKYHDVLGVMGLLISIEPGVATKLGSKLRKLLIGLNNRKNMLKSLQSDVNNKQ